MTQPDCYPLMKFQQINSLLLNSASVVKALAECSKILYWNITRISSGPGPKRALIPLRNPMSPLVSTLPMHYSLPDSYQNRPLSSAYSVQGPF